MHIEKHLLKPADYIKSPNFSKRAECSVIDLIVVHSISLPPNQNGTKYIKDFFCNNLDLSKHSYFKNIAHLKVSSHLLIDINGKITQFVAFDKKAWHAGISNFKDRDNCNEFSIGIELEGNIQSHFTNEQYYALNEVIDTLCLKYPIQFITGHCNIAPGRKKDPGKYFMWDKINNTSIEKYY